MAKTRFAGNVPDLPALGPVQSEAAQAAYTPRPIRRPGMAGLDEAGPLPDFGAAQDIMGPQHSGVMYDPQTGRATFAPVSGGPGSYVDRDNAAHAQRVHDMVGDLPDAPPQGDPLAKMEFDIATGMNQLVSQEDQALKAIDVTHASAKSTMNSKFALQKKKIDETTYETADKRAAAERDHEYAYKQATLDFSAKVETDKAKVRPQFEEDRQKYTKAAEKKSAYAEHLVGMMSLHPEEAEKYRVDLHALAGWKYYPQTEGVTPEKQWEKLTTRIKYVNDTLSSMFRVNANNEITEFFPGGGADLADPRGGRKPTEEEKQIGYGLMRERNSKSSEALTFLEEFDPGGAERLKARHPIKSALWKRAAGLFLSTPFMNVSIGSPQAEQPASRAVTKPTAGRIEVMDSQGTRFTVPRKQLKDAQKQGYTLVK